MTTGKVIVGILGAAAAGLVIGMLIAPEKGSEFRKSIAQTSDDWLDELARIIGKGKEFLNEAQQKASDTVESMQGEGRNGRK